MIVATMERVGGMRDHHHEGRYCGRQWLLRGYGLFNRIMSQDLFSLFATYCICCAAVCYPTK